MLRTRAMQSDKKLNLFINLGSALIGVLVLGYVVYAAYHTATEPPCSERYPAPIRFALQTASGKALTPIDLQARAGLRDVGVIDNATVVAVNDGPSPDALEVKLRNLPGGDDASAKARNGIEFRWSPPGLSGATATCLAYSVWLPEKFDFGRRGLSAGRLWWRAKHGAPASRERPADRSVGMERRGQALIDRCSRR